MGRVASARVSKNWNLHLPSAVKSFMNIEMGDAIEFFPPMEDFTDLQYSGKVSIHTETMVVRVKRLYGPPCGKCGERMLSTQTQCKRCGTKRALEGMVMTEQEFAEMREKEKAPVKKKS